ncbi:hypothetical protein GMORB2_2999 [Geosmithia morbida]|uniref:Uncharacterized protein n=1 Tax=Geosmithia morbida TaxID=1094350 RepID=A0A9P4YP59_9HYPO|nr:uncharacterized protein GMORB2_2999 [Geosmithia morbida]KAF4120561.1 hypothetical protein GMORB2_2999 [Geosmithia morbida]
MFPRLALARRLPCLRGSEKTAGTILASRFRSIHSSSLGLKSPSFDVSLVKNDQAGLNIVFQGDSLPANLPGTKLSDTRTSLYLPDFWLRYVE